MSNEQELTVTGFVWKTHDGKSIPVADMATRHLFFTVRMIFNHSVPESMRLQPYKRWRLSHSMERRGAAVAAMLVELRDRPDLSEDMLRDLRRMRDALRDFESSRSKTPDQLEMKWALQ